MIALDTIERTRRKDALVAFIDQYWANYWTSPSYGEIAKEIGVSSKSTVQALLLQLVTEGRLEMRRQPSYQKSVLYRVRREH